MNPFANKWALLFVVAGFRLLGSELVGTDEQGGVLSQVARSGSTAGDASAPPQGPPIEVIEQPAVPEVIEPEEIPEEDLPQTISAEEAEDTADVGSDVAGEEGDQTEFFDEPVDDEVAE